MVSSPAKDRRCWGPGRIRPWAADGGVATSPQQGLGALRCLQPQPFYGSSNKLRPCTISTLLLCTPEAEASWGDNTALECPPVIKALGWIWRWADGEADGSHAWGHLRERQTPLICIYLYSQNQSWNRDQDPSHVLSAAPAVVSRAQGHTSQQSLIGHIHACAEPPQHSPSTDGNDSSVINAMKGMHAPVGTIWAVSILPKWHCALETGPQQPQMGDAGLKTVWKGLGAAAVFGSAAKQTSILCTETSGICWFGAIRGHRWVADSTAHSPTWHKSSPQPPVAFLASSAAAHWLQTYFLRWEQKNKIK